MRRSEGIRAGPDSFYFDEFQQRLPACTDDVASWMHANRLQLNTDKSELLWCTTSRRLHQLPSTPIRIGSDFIAPPANVRDLGIHLDCDLALALACSDDYGLVLRRPTPTTECSTLSLTVSLPDTRCRAGAAKTAVTEPLTTAMQH
jgi:hypothetical protein